jgi:hypothetical protein
MAKDGGAKANSVTYYSLLKWLLNTPHRNLVSPACMDHAEQLFLLIDESIICNDAAWLILEVHQREKRVTDISLFGKHGLLTVPITDRPKFSTLWPEYIQGQQKGSQCDADIWAEYDHTEAGYAFMGFFESCSSHDRDLAILSDWISFYIQCRELELGHCINKQLLQQNMDIISSAVEMLGYPAQIGFINRGKCAVKLVSEYSLDMIAGVAKFCRQHFSSGTLGQFSNSEILEQLLEDLCTNDSLPRISIDLDLVNGKLGSRLSLEEESTSHRGPSKVSSANADSGDTRPLRIFPFPSYFDNYHKSKELELLLPYAERRPSPNLVDKEVLCIRHSHRKFILSDVGADIKDYIHITGGRV